MEIKNNLQLKGKYKITTYKTGTDEVVYQSDWISNLIVLNSGHGANIVLKCMLGDDDYDLEITEMALGTDNTAPSNNDTDLKSQKGDYVQVVTREETGINEILLSFFFSDAQLPNDTYKEVGLYCAGRKLFARSIISSAYTKSTGQDTKIDYVITISNS